MNGIVTVDGDYTGHAIPEIQQTTPYIFEKRPLPITTCDSVGNTATITNAINRHMAEHIDKPRGIQVLGSRAFGYDIDYKPIEDIVG